MWLQKWKARNGLDYNGWKMFLFKRFLRKIKLDILIPFDYYQNDYDDGLQYLRVYRWGRMIIETRKWKSDNDYNMLSLIVAEGTTNKRYLYNHIQDNTQLISTLSKN